tara:strand:- start:2898 stop:3224 length:327 start_codon:yes stop_codon:yes gene_type:complete
MFLMIYRSIIKFFFPVFNEVNRASRKRRSLKNKLRRLNKKRRKKHDIGYFRDFMYCLNTTGQDFVKSYNESIVYQHHENRKKWMEYSKILQSAYAQIIENTQNTHNVD